MTKTPSLEGALLRAPDVAAYPPGGASRPPEEGPPENAMTAVAFNAMNPRSDPHRAVRAWTDEKTGRRVRQLTTEGGSLEYFRFPRHAPGGWMIARLPRHGMVKPDTNEQRPLNQLHGAYLKLRTSDGVLFTHDPRTREVFATELPDGACERLGQVAPEVAGYVTDITCDGRTVILLDHHQYENAAHPLPNTKNPADFWHYMKRPRHGRMLAHDLATGRTTLLYQGEDHCPFHVDTHPSDPTLARFSIDLFEAYNQRVWSVRTDGSGLHKIRPQESGELVTHEFWWADGKHVGYTYQDRRNDPTARDFPWAEYSRSQTRLGIADLAGKEVFLSDPINHYHTHLYCSFNGKLVSGSGTEHGSFVYAARFDWKNPKIEMTPLATIHTPYIPFRGQGVNCDFSADGRWLLYTDTMPDGKTQLCAVEVDM
jgi:oligogalacturonide lyase